MYLEDSDSVELDSFSGYDNKEDQKDSIPSSDVHDTVCDKRQHLTLKCHFAYISVLLLGITSLLPWHSLITSVDYFNYLFPGIESDIAVPYTITSFLTAAAVSGCGGTRVPVNIRIYGSLIGYLACILVIPIALYANHLYRWVIIVASCLIGFFDSWVQSGIFGFASFLSPLHIGAHQFGLGISGCVIILLRIITKVSLPSNTEGSKESAILYFIISGAFIVLTVVCYAISSRLKYASHQLSRATELKKISINETEEKKETEEIVVEEPVSKLEIIKKTWSVMLGIFCVFVTSLSVFPALTVEMKSDHFLTHNGWYPLALYNFGETLGRGAPQIPFFRSISRKTAFTFVGLRVLLIPLFIVSVTPRWIANHYAHMAFVSVLGITHGYLAAIMVTFLPSMVTIRERDLALSMSVMALMVGLAVGSIVGKILTLLVEY